VVEVTTGSNGSPLLPVRQTHAAATVDTKRGARHAPNAAFEQREVPGATLGTAVVPELLAAAAAAREFTVEFRLAELTTVSYAQGWKTFVALRSFPWVPVERLNEQHAVPA
jgi:hypothetical protein